MTSSSTARFALYLAPEADTALWRFGSDWLGYDAETGLECAQPPIPGLSPEAFHAATADPRGYGFHITLKAPFRLAPGCAPEALEAAIAALAARHLAVGPVDLILETRPAGSANNFLCLVPATRNEAIHALEQDAVIALDGFRAPLSEAEYARRRPERLAPRERAHLDTYGYPYILDAYRPHFSLTGALEVGEPYRAAAAAALAAEPTLSRFDCRALVLFEQPAAGARFRVRRRFPLARA